MKNKIRQIRNALGLNQSEFGEKLGVSRSVIVNAELGRANINDLFVNHLIEVYNVNPEWFKTGNGDMFLKSSSSLIDLLAKEHNLSALDRSILESFLDLSPDQRQAVITIIKGLSGK